jgi:hypothetical protein
MPSDRTLRCILLAALAAGFLAGVVHLFSLRFRQGDIYPAYSSFRTDPLGASVLFEALGMLPGVEARRGVVPLERDPDLEGASLLFLGIGAGDWSATRAEMDALARVAEKGGRVVFAFYPEKAAGNDGDEEAGDRAGDEDEGDGDEESLDSTVYLEDELGVELEVREPLKGEPEAGSLPATIDPGAGPGLPRSMGWHSSLYFVPRDPAWRTVYAAEGHPVVVERRWKKGTVVLVSDPYLLSNEALMRECLTGLLAWLVGAHRKVVFDETHLGVFKDGNIASLARRYRLEWSIATLVIIALLFVWKNAVPFVRRLRSDEDSHGEPGKDLAAGLTNLIRRNVRRDRLLETCVDEWEKTLAGSAKSRPDRAGEVRKILRETGRPGRKNPVEGYKAISRLLSGRPYE